MIVVSIWKGIFDWPLFLIEWVSALQVRCLVNHGEFETQDGNIIVLKKNSQVRSTFCLVILYCGVLAYEFV